MQQLSAAAKAASVIVAGRYRQLKGGKIKEIAYNNLNIVHFAKKGKTTLFPSTLAVSKK